jgi:DNA-binding NarL/FixJ family response regulator
VYAIALVSDLLFSSRIEAELSREGYRVTTVEDAGALALALALEREKPSVVILDLHAGVPAEDVVARCRPLAVPVLAFGRHTEPALLRAARDAGCALSVARSTFVEQLPSLVKELAARN